jgi:hypothetical protein
MIGKALCFLGYLMFRVFLETDNPYQEQIESAKNPKHNTNPNCGLDMFCLRRGNRQRCRRCFQIRRKPQLVTYYPTTPSLHYSVTPALRSPSLSFCGGPPEADVGCKKKHAKKEHATRVPPQEELRPTTAATTQNRNTITNKIRRRQSPSKSYLKLQTSNINRICPPSRDRRCYCSRGLPRNPADLRQRIQSREQTWRLSMHKVSG